MNDSVIPINDLYPGLLLENDLYDSFNNLQFIKGTVLTIEHLRELTMEKQAFFHYRSEKNDINIVSLLIQINQFLGKVTFVEESGVNLERMKKEYYFPNSFLDSDWKIQAAYDYLKKLPLNSYC